MSEGLLPPASASWKKHLQRNSRGNISFGVQKPSSVSALKTVLRTCSLWLMVALGHCPAPQAAADRQTDRHWITARPAASPQLCACSAVPALPNFESQSWSLPSSLHPQPCTVRLSLLTPHWVWGKDTQGILMSYVMAHE